MKVHILTAGYGKGHDRAAELLQRRAEDRQDVAQIFRPLEERMLYLFQSSKIAYKYSIRFYPDIWRTIAAMETASIQPVIGWLSRRLDPSFMTIFRSDFILSVHPLLTAVAADIKARHRIRTPLYNIATDYWTPPITSHPMVNGWFTSKLDKPSFIQSGQFVCPTGLPALMEKRKLSKKETHLRNGWDGNKPLILLCGGGTGWFPYKKVLNVLTKRETPSTIVMMGDKKARKKEMVIRGHDVYVKTFSADYLEYLQAADLLISKAGGMTMAEAALGEVPLIIYSPLPGQEEKNAARFVENKAAYWAHSTQAIKVQADELLNDPFKQVKWKRRLRRMKEENSVDTILSISKTFSWEEKRKEYE
ncbi:glycosyltransferase [Alteribacillus iranensis]|uniref:UDP-N-acetylglucosamine:LPS N-acetylglucosamine transferase n=1 Tax=Alteribacillus iranensis TaxID=930128 RepID=A0A1I2CZS4_9BACI|nr:glycosyltransferase [Alteribacillus iranensis]SFE73240.1 UDP-N-acetylglucosamine:LPS N-acetylglucosamine transferase [Alteribacillus iranensis]